LAAKAAKNSIPLWILFIAVQLLDVFWSIFVLLDIEKVRIVPGITATNPLDLYYMPYTHSLLGAMLWSVAAGVAYYMFRRPEGWSADTIVGAAVLSHWALDWLVHRPDLPLYDNSLKVGLGLWNYPAFAFVLEIAVLFGGMSLYLKTTKPVARGGGMLAVQAYVFFGPPPTSDKAAAITALVSYLGFDGIAYWLERKRAPRTA
jgi:hypothetical protein